MRAEEPKDEWDSVGDFATVFLVEEISERRFFDSEVLYMS